MANKAVGDVQRLEILRLLAKNSFGVVELATIFQQKQSGMSHHLKILAEAGLVSTRREGNSIFYSRTAPNPSDALYDWQHQQLNSIDKADLRSELLARQKNTLQSRADASRSFFNKLGPAMTAQQELIAEHKVYAQAVLAFIEKSQMAHFDTALEIGPGVGEFLPLLGKHFTQVTALDNSPIMLKQAKAYCQQLSCNNITYCEGDAETLSQRFSAIDCIAINMVLHHTPAPADVIAEAASALQVGGTLIISELCQHDQTWVSEACGDQWLGFSPSQLDQWATVSGLTIGPSQYLAQRNGFQLQIRQFFKPFSLLSNEESKHV